jgi:hypothetical protein
MWYVISACRYLVQLTHRDIICSCNKPRSQNYPVPGQTLPALPGQGATSLFATGAFDPYDVHDGNNYSSPQRRIPGGQAEIPRPTIDLSLTLKNVSFINKLVTYWNTRRAISATCSAPVRNQSLTHRLGSFRSKPHVHSNRYISSSTGRCRLLKVQAKHPSGPAERKISGGVHKFVQHGVWIAQHTLFDPKFTLQWIAKWFLFAFWTAWALFRFGIYWGAKIFWVFILQLDWPSTVVADTYKRYLSGYRRHLWLACSRTEHSKHKPQELTLPRGDPGSEYSILHASYPRALVVKEGETWKLRIVDGDLIYMDYLAVSYRWSDFGDTDYLRTTVRSTCNQLGFKAYWMDSECLGESDAEKNVDLYRMSDVYRGAKQTLIMIQPQPAKDPDDKDTPERRGWKSWGGRVWTLPEALLSRNLLCKVGNNDVQEISLRQIGNHAYEVNEEEMAIIDGLSGKDVLHRLERLTMLKNALWRRATSGHAANVDPDAPKTLDHPAFRFRAEKVYALMGFFEHRIMPDASESSLTALARLSMANDSDRVAERMIAMLPDSIQDKACWYADHDAFGAKLWHIEPAVQLAGTSETEAIVLDGCRAACIRWKDFPAMSFSGGASYKRKIAFCLPMVALLSFLVGIILLVIRAHHPHLAHLLRHHHFGVLFLFLGILLFIASPKAVEYGTSEVDTFVEPWLVGVKGYVSARRLSRILYGGSIVAYTPSGSTLSRPKETGDDRAGDADAAENAVKDEEKKLADGEAIYTLVDTHSNSICHFKAKRPPTVCVYVGREGGLGRYLLCSENCTGNELHKESVIRLPTYISDYMLRTDWLAIGSVPCCKEDSCDTMTGIDRV